MQAELHATYGNDEIKAALGGASLESAGMTGVGRLHFPEIRTIAALITFQKTDKEFSPSTMYKDYPVSRELLNWETQAPTSQASKTGQTLIHHHARGYTMLFFARARKKIDSDFAIYVTRASKAREFQVRTPYTNALATRSSDACGDVRRESARRVADGSSAQMPVAYANSKALSMQENLHTVFGLGEH